MELLNLIERACQNGWPGYRDVETGQFIPAFLGAKGKVSPPGRSEEERQLTQQQIELSKEQIRLAREQEAEYKAFQPYLYEDYGLTVNPITGKLERTAEAQSLRAQSAEITRLQQERSLEALKGQLEVSPTLEREIEGGANALRERLVRQLGPGWETSTPGIQAMREFEAQAEALREAERRDQLTTAESLALARQGFKAGTAGSFAPSFQAPREALGASFMRAGQTTKEAIAPFAEDRALALRANMQNAQSSAADRSGWMSGGSSLGAAGIIGLSIYA